MDSIELNERFSKLQFNTRAHERLKKYKAGEEVDCIPYGLFNTEVVVGEYFGYTTSVWGSDFTKEKEIIEFKRDVLGLEDMYIGMTLRTLGQAFGSKVKSVEHGPDLITEYCMEDYSKLNQLKVINPYENEVLSKGLERARKLRENFPELPLTNLVKGPFSAAMGARSAEKVLKDTRNDRERLTEFLDICLYSNLEWVKACYQEFGQTTTLISDPSICGNLLGKKQLLEWGLPYFTKMFNGIKEITNGAPIEVHICGKTHHFWEELAQLDIYDFSIDDCEDLEHAKNLIGDRLMIAGNVPPINILKNGSIDDVYNHCKQSIIKCGDSPKGYMLFAGCDVAYGTPMDNLKACILAAKELGKGAQIGRLPKGLSPEI